MLRRLHAVRVDEESTEGDEGQFGGFVSKCVGLTQVVMSDVIVQVGIPWERLW